MDCALSSRPSALLSRRGVSVLAAPAVVQMEAIHTKSTYRITSHPSARFVPRFRSLDQSERRVLASGTPQCMGKLDLGEAERVLEMAFERILRQTGG